MSVVNRALYRMSATAHMYLVVYWTYKGAD
jgi:hypothetical protein